MSEECTGEIVVVKVGGSLFTEPFLAKRLAEVLHRLSPRKLILISGGGRLADAVRDLDQTHSLGTALAHELAVRTMSLSAQFLAAIVVSGVVVDSDAEIQRAWRAGKIPVCDPVKRFVSHPRLPAGWEVTSDSIAAVLAEELGASTLVLLKSMNLPDLEMPLQQSAGQGFVDAAFPDVAKYLPQLLWCNLRDHDVHYDRWTPQAAERSTS